MSELRSPFHSSPCAGGQASSGGAVPKVALRWCSTSYYVSALLLTSSVKMAAQPRDNASNSHILEERG